MDKSDKSIEFAKQYDADLVYEEKWRPLITELIETKNG
jgi:hypothetical protein